ncbi:MAG TPA: sugar ABC transporter permease [Firmicutes bacterium]|nr:sugar ABC transporter permease [Bacillota bacterium]
MGGKSGQKRRINRLSYAFMAPWLLAFLIFTLVPIAASVGLSFTSFNMGPRIRWVGLGNYLRLLLDDDVFLIALRNTLLYAVVTGPLGYVLSFLIAWLINDLGRNLRSALTLLFYAPSLASNIYVIWTFIFSGDSYGLLNSWLIRLGLIRETVNWLNDPAYNSIVVIIVILWMSMGAGFLAFVAGLQQLNPTLCEAGAIDGIRNRWQELWYITIPQMLPQLLFGAVMAISGAFAVGYQNAALTGMPSTDYSTHTLLLHMIDYGYTRFEIGYASAVATVLFTLMIATWAVVQRAFAKRGC